VKRASSTLPVCSLGTVRSNSVVAIRVWPPYETFAKKAYVAQSSSKTTVGSRLALHKSAMSGNAKCKRSSSNVADLLLWFNEGKLACLRVPACQHSFAFS
jgi:hypothetical protein